MLARWAIDEFWKLVLLRAALLTDARNFHLVEGNRLLAPWEGITLSGTELWNSTAHVLPITISLKGLGLQR